MKQWGRLLWYPSQDRLRQISLPGRPEYMKTRHLVGHLYWMTPVGKD